jgi:FkbM family methyltransferase
MPTRHRDRGAQEEFACAVRPPAPSLAPAPLGECLVEIESGHDALRAAMLPFDLMAQALVALAAAPGDTSGLQARIRLTRQLEDAFTRIVAALAPPLVLEIGAHEAGFSNRIKRMLPDARVVAFEANPEVHARHAEANARRGVQYHQLCVADRSGSLTFQVPAPEGRSGDKMGSMLGSNLFGSAATFDVPCVTADGFLGADSGQPNAIWLDVEGAIATVLRGAPRTLSACLAFYAEMEVTRRWSEQQIDAEIVPALRAQGLHLVLRDRPNSFQYNGLFLRDSVLAHPGVVRSCRRLVRNLAELHERAPEPPPPASGPRRPEAAAARP